HKVSHIEMDRESQTDLGRLSSPLIGNSVVIYGDRAFGAHGDWRNAGALAPPVVIIVNIGLARLVDSCLEGDRTHIREEHLLVSAGEGFNGVSQRQPFHGFDIVHRLADGSANDSHMPKLHDLDPAIYRIQHQAKKTAD